MIRGVAGCALFLDDADRRDLVARLDRLVPLLGFVCLAWVLMSNHVHLVLRTGPVPLSQLMASLETGFAQRFNRRHGRAGHLVQNRFRSILVEDDSYLAAVIAYVFRNPIEAALCSEATLGEYAWCGFGAVAGVRVPRPFEAVGATLAAFGGDPGALFSAIARAESVPDPVQWRGFPRAKRPAADARHRAAFAALLRAEASLARVPHEAILGGSRLRAIAAARRRIATRATLDLGLRASE
ncbi:MAG: transposase, partial [Myxococcota bacterium]